MSRRKTSTTAPDHQPPATVQPPPVATCGVPRPDDPDEDLTEEEERAFELLVDVANANEEASRDRRAERRQGREAPKTRVEFSSLTVRARAVRFLLDYFSGVPPSRSLRSLGLSWGDVQICRFASQDYERVYQLVRYQMGERLQDKALETVERTLDGLDVTSQAAQSARWILERLAGGSYQDPRYQYMRQAQGLGASGGGVVYQINVINTSAAPDQAAITAPRAPRLCGECVDIATAEAEKVQ